MVEKFWLQIVSKRRLFRLLRTILFSALCWVPITTFPYYFLIVNDFFDTIIKFSFGEPVNIQHWQDIHPLRTDQIIFFISGKNYYYYPIITNCGGIQKK